MGAGDVPRRAMLKRALALLAAYGVTGRRRASAGPSEIKSGRVGLWTKADSTTAFDDLTIRGVTGGG